MEYPFSVNVNKYVEFIYLTTIHIYLITSSLGSVFRRRHGQTPISYAKLPVKLFGCMCLLDGCGLKMITVTGSVLNHEKTAKFNTIPILHSFSRPMVACYMLVLLIINAY